MALERTMASKEATAMRASKPWLRFYGDVPQSIDYPQVTLYEAVAETVRKYPDDPAYDFMGFTSTYRRFLDEIDRCANALAALGHHVEAVAAFDQGIATAESKGDVQAAKEMRVFRKRAQKALTG
jgi:hypothetical protein